MPHQISSCCVVICGGTANERARQNCAENAFLRHRWDEVAGFLHKSNGGQTGVLSLQDQQTDEKAGGGNRTRVTSLEGWGFTPKLHPQCR